MKSMNHSALRQRGSVKYGPSPNLSSKTSPNVLMVKGDYPLFVEPNFWNTQAKKHPPASASISYVYMRHPMNHKEPKKKHVGVKIADICCLTRGFRGAISSKPKNRIVGIHPAVSPLYMGRAQKPVWIDPRWSGRMEHLLYVLFRTYWEDEKTHESGLVWVPRIIFGHGSRVCVDHVP